MSSSAGFNRTTSRFKAFCTANTDPPHSDVIPNNTRPCDHIPTMEPANNTDRDGDSSMRLMCCCGRPGCAYLEHNNTVLGGLERDLETAARLGQALLTRHESYISESQLEHSRLSTHVADLEVGQASLQTSNESVVAENRELLSQLEMLNSNLRKSDDHVKGLESLLRDCELEVRRLTNLARRTEELEGKVIEMERDQHDFNQQIGDEQAESRSMLSRWRDSERRVKDLEIELQKIEWEAKLDREKHEEIVGRLNRERVLERELGGAEARLKGAAAVQSLNGKGADGKNVVVSHFVRDILQDNANLQAGITELRELLQTSNEEVQNLREQVMQHQPIRRPSQGDLELSSSMPLDEELGWNEPSPKPVQQEVHVHHHYHAKPAARKDRVPIARRPSRKRALMGTTPESSVPSTPISRPQRYASSPVVPLSLHHPQPRTSNRWSMQSAATGSTALSSMPSSPRSYFDRNSSIFDRIEQVEDSSRPTSPESAAGFSSPPPRLRSRGQKGQSEDFLLGTFDEEAEDDQEDGPEDEGADGDSHTIEVHDGTSEILQRQKDVNRSDDRAVHDLTPKPSILLPSANLDSMKYPPDPRPPDPEPELQTDHASSAISQDDFSAFLSSSPPRPNHHRSSSHESLVSISGMDIHLHAPRHPKSSLTPITLLRGNSSHFAFSPSQARKISAAQPLATVTEFTATSNQVVDHGPATPTTSRNASTSIEALSGLAGGRIPLRHSATSESAESAATVGTGGLGRLVGGWVRGKWGIAPVKSSGDLRARAQTMASAAAPPPLPKPQSQSQTPHAAAPAVNPAAAAAAADLFAGRSPGINQKGAIPGFRVVPVRTPSEIHAKVVDVEGLMDGLAE